MMRKLATRLVLWLCARYGITLLDELRTNASPDAVIRGRRWEEFYNEEGGLRDMIASIRQSYFEQASAIGHRDDSKLYEFVVADRQSRELEREVIQIIASGKSALQHRENAERDEAARILRAI